MIIIDQPVVFRGNTTLRGTTIEVVGEILEVKGNLEIIESELEVPNGLTVKGTNRLRFLSMDSLFNSHSLILGDFALSSDSTVHVGAGEINVTGCVDLAGKIVVDNSDIPSQKVLATLQLLPQLTKQVLMNYNCRSGEFDRVLNESSDDIENCVGYNSFYMYVIGTCNSGTVSTVANRDCSSRTVELQSAGSTMISPWAISAIACLLVRMLV